MSDTTAEPWCPEPPPEDDRDDDAVGAGFDADTEEA